MFKKVAFWGKGISYPADTIDGFFFLEGQVIPSMSEKVLKEILLGGGVEV